MTHLGRSPAADMTLAALTQEIARVEVSTCWAHDHPYSGVCGEDDARADYLAELKAERNRRMRAGTIEDFSIRPLPSFPCPEWPAVVDAFLPAGDL